MDMLIAEAKSATESPDYEGSAEDEKLDAMMEKLTVAQRKTIVAAVKKMITELGG